MERTVVHHDEIVVFQHQGQIEQVFQSSRQAAEPSRIESGGLHPIELFGMVREESADQQVMIAGNGRQAQCAHPFEGAVARGKPADKIPQTIDGVGLQLPQMIEARFQGSLVAVDIAKEGNAHASLQCNWSRERPESWVAAILLPFQTSRRLSE